MSWVQRAWLIVTCSLVMAVPAIGEEALIPAGESPSILKGVTWSPLSGLRGVASSPDGSLFASVSDDGTLRLWNSAESREVRRFPAVPGGQTAVTFSGDGRLVAAGGADGSIQVWETATGHDRGSLPSAGVAIASMALNQDGTALLFIPQGKPAEVWRPAEKAAPAPLQPGDVDARVVQLSRDGRTFAVGLSTRTVLLVNAHTLKVEHVLKGFSAIPTALAFGPDGHTFAVGTDSGAVQLTAIPDGYIMRTIDAHSRPITGVRFVVDGVLATTAQDGTIRFSSADGRELRRVAMNEHCCTHLAALDGERTVLATTAQSLLRVDVASGAPLPPLVGPASPTTAVGMDFAAHALLVGSLDGSLRLFDVGVDIPRQSWSLPDTVTAAVVSADSRTVVAAEGRAVVIWNADSGKEIRRLIGHDAPVTALAISADGTRVASGAGDHSARVWETKTGKLIAQVTIPGAVTAIALTRDGKHLAVVTDGDVRVWPVDHPTSSKRLIVEGTPTSVSFSKDGTRLAAGTAGGNVQIFDVVSGDTLTKVSFGDAKAVTGVALIVDGKQLVAASQDKTVRLWSLSGGGSEIARLDGLADGATALAVSGNDAEAAVGTGDGAVHLWKLADHSTPAVFRQAAAGWLIRRGDKVLRGEGGLWVVRPDTTTGLLSSVEPKGADATKAELTSDIIGTSPPTEAGRAGRITLRVTNTSAINRAYWVQVVASGKLPRGLTIIPSAIVNRLDPGNSVELSVEVTWVSRGEPPAPRNQVIPLKMIQLAGGTPVTPPVSLMLRAAKVDVHVMSIEGSRKAPFVRVEVMNDGEESTGPLSLMPVFVKSGENVWTAPSVEIKDLAPHEKTIIGIAATPQAARADASLMITAIGTLWPTDRWSVTVPLSRPLPWLLMLAVLVSVIILIVAGYLFRVLRHPVVIQVTRSPAELLKYNLTRLPEVTTALSRAGRLSGALTAANISPVKWRRMVAAGRSAEDAAVSFTETIGAKREEKPIVQGQAAWILELPSLDLRFPRRTALVVCTGAQLEMGAAAGLASAIHAGGEGPTVAIALDLTAEQNARAALHAMPRMSFVVLSADQTRDVLVSSEPLVVLQKVISAQRPLAELSPYQTSSGIDDEGLFFGRDRELRDIADRALHNFIIVAPRQMGKSSLLKAVQRRLSARTDVEVHHITLFEDDLASRVGRALNRPRPESADQFVDLAAGSRRKPRVWLIDEADSFIVKDARNRYPIAQAMRTLSEEGRAYFILAGFWHLYAAAFLNPNNPLRNFGELMRLEPLDREAARALATKPMEALGVRYEQEVMVDRLLDMTACRAHLVVAACKGLIEQLGPDDRVITEDALEAGLYRNPAIADEFKYWRREPLGRALLRAALLGAPPSRGELRERLSRSGLDAPTEMYSAALDRLELGFLLVPNAEGKLVCPVPLLRRFVEQEDTLEAGLKRDVQDFLANQRGGRAATG